MNWTSGLRSFFVFSLFVWLQLMVTSAFAQSDPQFDEESAAYFENPDSKPKFNFADKNLEEQRREYLEKAKTLDRDLDLFFDPRENGVDYPEQVIDYDLSGGSVMRMGPLNIESKEVSIQLTRESGVSDEFDFGLELKSRRLQVYVVSFTWPISYVGAGRLEVIDQDNKVLFRKDLSDEDVWRWSQSIEDQKGYYGEERVSGRSSVQEQIFMQNLLEDQRQGSAKGRRKISKVHWESNFGLVGRDFLHIPIWQMKKAFRFCVSKVNKEGRIAVCSKRYKVFRSGGRYSIRALKYTVRPKVLINDRKVTLKGSAIFLDQKSPIKFAALLNDGSYYEFVSSPKPTNVLDLYHDTKTNELVVSGYGNPPMGQVEVISREDQGFWEFLNFLPTIGNFKNFWRARTPMDKPHLYLKGSGGAPFKQAFFFEKVPTDRSRVRLKNGAPESTYSETINLKGLKSAIAEVSSTEQQAKSTSETEFDWDFLADKAGGFNRSHLLVKDGDETWKAYYEVYRAHNLEFSARLTGVVTDGLDLLLLGELAGQYWFEHLGWWDNPTYSNQRWGIAARRFTTVGSTGGDGEVEPPEITVSNIDLKYRLTSGVWGRDPTVGLILGAQNAILDIHNEDIGLIDLQMVGGGVFWARSMPKLFDAVFNVIPIFRYPKWVDFEAVWYPISLDTDKQLTLSVALNFHGKIQWTKRFFGEAGFGMKTFAYKDRVLKKGLGFGLAYATFGLGYNF